MLVNASRIEAKLNEFKSYVPTAISKFNFTPAGEKGTLSYMKDKFRLFGENLPAFINDLELKGQEILSHFSQTHKDEAPTLKHHIEEAIKGASAEYKKRHWD